MLTLTLTRRAASSWTLSSSPNPNPNPNPNPHQEGGLFLDIIIPEEYDPRICREKDIKYRVKADEV